MLHFLTRYLFKHKTVTIPFVGTLVLKEQPAHLEIAEKIIYPPDYNITFDEKDSVDEKQLRILSEETGKDYSAVENELTQFSKRITDSIRDGEFYWRGIGKFWSVDEKISFESTSEGNLLQPVSAQKVIRENVQHNVLVGDSTITSHQNEKPFNLKRKKRSFRLLPYWIILLLGVLFIIYHFNKEGFNTSSAGYKSTVVPKTTLPTYKK